MTKYWQNKGSESRIYVGTLMFLGFSVAIATVWVGPVYSLSLEIQKHVYA